MFPGSFLPCMCTFVTQKSGYKGKVRKVPGPALPGAGNSCGKSLELSSSPSLRTGTSSWPTFLLTPEVGSHGSSAFWQSITLHLVISVLNPADNVFSFKLISQKGSQSGAEENERWRSHHFPFFLHIKAFLYRDFKIWEWSEFEGIHFHLLSKRLWGMIFLWQGDTETWVKAIKLWKYIKPFYVGYMGNLGRLWKHLKWKHQDTQKVGQVLPSAADLRAFSSLIKSTCLISSASSHSTNSYVRQCLDKTGLKKKNCMCLLAFFIYNCSVSDAKEGNTVLKINILTIIW